jgi:hypothetical protein
LEKQDARSLALRIQPCSSQAEDLVFVTSALRVSRRQNFEDHPVLPDDKSRASSRV